MKFINVFIASSIIEFEQERVYIGDHIRRLNDKSYDEGYYVKLYLCEDDSENLQATYDRKIENSDIFFALIGERLGEKTKHELYIAEHSDSIISRHIIVNNECNLSIIPQEIIQSFQIYAINSFNRELLFHYIDSRIHSIVNQITDTQFSPAIKSFSLNIPHYNDSYELAIISNIIRVLKDRFEDELQLQISNSFTGRYNAYLSLLSENQNYENERLLKITLDENLRSSIWLFENLQYSDDKSELTKKIISDLYEYGNYHITYNSNKQLQLSFYRKLADALNSFKSFIEVKYIIVNHILYEESQRTYKRQIIKNLYTTHLDHINQRRLEQSIVNITNLYVITGQLEKLKKSLLKLEDSDFEYFIFNPDIISPELPFTEYYDTLIKYIYDSIEYLNYKSSNYTGDEIKNKLSSILNVIIERSVRLELTDNLSINYLCGKLLLSYNDQYIAAKDYYVKAYEAYEAYEANKSSKVNKEIHINYIKDIILDLCEKGFEYNDNEQILTWVNKGKEFVNTDDIGYQVRLLAYEARGHRDCNPLLSAELYNTAILILIEKDLYKQVDDLLDLYISIKFEILFDKYRSISDSDTDEMEVLKKQASLLYELYKRYLTNSNFWSSEVSILYLLGLFNVDISFCMKADNLLNSYVDKRVNQEWKNDLEYVKALILKKNQQYKESNEILLALAERYKGPISKASCYQIAGNNYSYMYDSQESLELAKQAYKKALDLNKSLGSRIYDGLSYCCLMTKDFREAEKYARKALLKDNKFNENKYANYITSLLCQNKYIKAFYTYAIKCKRNQNIKKIMERDWNTDLGDLGINTTHFHTIFMLDKRS